MPITSGNHPKLLWPGLKKVWDNEGQDIDLKHTRIFNMATSDKSFEETKELAGFGLANVKPEGDSVVYDTDIDGYLTRYTNVTYAKGFIVTEEAVEDNQYLNIATKRAKSLRRSMEHTKETIAANLFNYAFTSGYNGGDGVRFVYSAHPTANGTQSNALGTAADLSEAAIEDLGIQIMNATDTRGLRLALKPRSLVIPTSLWFEATRILKSELRVDTANNDVNAIRSTGMFSGGIIPWTFLTDTDAWFITTDAMNGLQFFTRRALAFDKDGDFETGNFKHKASMRFSLGYDDWRCVFGSEGA